MFPRFSALALFAFLAVRFRRACRKVIGSTATAPRNSQSALNRCRSGPAEKRQENVDRATCLALRLAGPTPLRAGFGRWRSSKTGSSPRGVNPLRARRRFHRQATIADPAAVMQKHAEFGCDLLLIWNGIDKGILRCGAKVGQMEVTGLRTLVANQGPARK